MADMLNLGPTEPSEPKSDKFIRGYQEAEQQFYEDWPTFTNPFEPDSEEDRGFKEAVYDFTEK